MGRNGKNSLNSQVSEDVRFKESFNIILIRLNKFIRLLLWIATHLAYFLQKLKHDLAHLN